MVEENDSNRLPVLTQLKACRSRPRRPVGGASRGVIAALVALTIAAAGAAVTPTPAWAGGGLAVSPASGLDPAGAFVVVSGTGFAPNTQLFVMQCKGGSGSDHTCNSVGLRKVTTDASGSFTANAMRVVGRFGATDCLVQSCLIMTSAVSGHSGDRSQDVTSGLAFSPALAPAPDVSAPPPTPPTAPPAADTTLPRAPSPTPVPDAGSTSTAVGAVSSVPATSTTTPSTPTSATTEPGDPSNLASEQASGGNDPADVTAAAASDLSDSSDGTPVGLILGGLTLGLALAAGGAVALARRRSRSA